MTEHDKDKNVQENFGEMSFKEKILADLASATEKRHRQREELLQKAQEASALEREEQGTPEMTLQPDPIQEESLQEVTTVPEVERVVGDLDLSEFEALSEVKAIFDAAPGEKKASEVAGEVLAKPSIVDSNNFEMTLGIQEDKADFSSDFAPLEDEHLVIAPDLVSFEKAEEVHESSPVELSQEEVENLPRKRLENPIDLSFPAREEETRPLEDLKEPSLPDLSQIKAIFDGAPKSKEATLDRFERAEESEAVMPESLPSEPEESNISEDSISTVEEDIMSRESRKKTNRLATKVSTIIVSLLVALLLAGAFFTYTYVKSAIEPVDKNSTEFVQVEIPSGSGNKLIGQILEENGIIKNATVFNLYTKFKNYSGFQSGYYNFQKSMSLDDIAKYLQEGGTSEPTTPALGKIVIPEGYTLKQISEAVTVNTKDNSNATPFTAEDFMATIQDETFIAELKTKYPNLLESLPEAADVKYQLEGYLFPATYEYYQETSLKDLIEQMVAAMDANLSPYYAQIKNGSMTVNQVLTMASLVEKEGATDDDREMIASVFYNRWNIDMPLQSNIAILYAMDKLGQETTLAEDAAIDTSIDSPYNIYSNTGLMPGPVDSPGMSAILATINPAKTDYYYFVADVKTGTVYFAKTYEEHSANVEKYINSQLQ